MRWQKKQGLTLVITGLLMGAAVYGTDQWKSKQMLAQVCAKPIAEPAGKWEDCLSQVKFLKNGTLTGVVLMCSDRAIKPEHILPRDIPKSIKVICLYPDSLSIQAMDQYSTQQRASWSTELHRQYQLYKKLERQRLSIALNSSGEQRTKDVQAALLPLDLLTQMRTQAYRSSVAGLLLGEFARQCISREESRWLLIYDGLLHQEIKDKFTKNPRIHYEEWGDE